jgi:hypothetical protein
MSFRDNHSLSLMLFEGGLVYGIYQSNYKSEVSPEFVYAGFFVGTTNDQLGGASTYRTTDFNFEDHASTAATLKLVGRGSESVDGQLTISGGASDIIGATSGDASTMSTDTTTLAGTYVGYLRSVSGGVTLSASIDATGKLSATALAGCSISATLKPRKLGHLYDAEATIGASCPSPAGRYVGHGMQSFGTRNVYLMLTANGAKDLTTDPEGSLHVRVTDEGFAASERMGTT